MAVIDIQGFIDKLNNGEIDLDTWEKIVNANELVVATRLNGNVNTWFGLQAALSAATGLVYTSKSAMDAAPGTKVGQAARVTEGADKGLYLWDGSNWVKTIDPIEETGNNANPVFVPFERDGVISPEPTTFMAFIKDMTVHGAGEDKEYQVRFFQNNSDYFGDGHADGLIIVEFDAGAWTGERIVVNRNPPIVIDRSLSKQSIHIESNNTPGLSFTLLVSPSSLPPEGTPINAGASGNPGYSWKISRLCHELSTTGMQNQIVSIDDRLSLIEGGALKDLRNALMHPTKSVNVRLVGDSITWGRTVPGSSTYLPNNGYITDARDNLNSNSWANLLRKWLGQTYAGGNVVEDAPGSGYYEITNVVDAIGADFEHFKFKTGDKTFTRADVVPTTQAAALTGKYYDIVSVNAVNASTRPTSIEFDLIGDNLEVVYAQLTNGTALNTVIELYGNGVKLGEFSQYGSPAAFGQSHNFTFPFGHYHMQLVNKSEATFLRFEGLRFKKRIKVSNDGINGSSTATWLNRVTINDSIQPTDEYVFVQLGTNDRIVSTINTTNPYVLKNNLKAIAGIAATITNGHAKVILMSANAVTQSEVLPTFSFDMRRVNQVIKDTAAELGVNFISQYEATMQLKIDGTAFLADNLHPNELGHRFMFENIRNRILNA